MIAPTRLNITIVFCVGQYISNPLETSSSHQSCKLGGDVVAGQATSTDYTTFGVTNSPLTLQKGYSE